MQSKLPDFFVIGAPKAGTTSLFYYLSNSNYFFKPPVKEPGYFVYNHNEFITKSNDEECRNSNFIIDFENYKSIYNSCPKNQITGDFSTHYLYHSSKFIKNIQYVFGEESVDVPIIIILRNPIDRAFSHYQMNVRDDLEHLSFKSAIAPETISRRLERGFLPSFDYIGFSRYKKNVEIIKSFFSNVLVIDFEDFIQKKNFTLNEIADFLSIDIDTSNLGNIVYNKSGIPKKTVFSRALYWILYKDNFLKGFLSDNFKEKFTNNLGKKVKSLLFPYTLAKMKITEEERQIAESFLRSELLFYQGFCDDPIQLDDENNIQT